MSYRPTCFIYRYDSFPLNPSYVHLTTTSFPRDFNKTKRSSAEKKKQLGFCNINSSERSENCSARYESPPSTIIVTYVRVDIVYSKQITVFTFHGIYYIWIVLVCIIGHLVVRSNMSLCKRTICPSNTPDTLVLRYAILQKKVPKLLTII